MKICWDNLERVRLSSEGNFRIGPGIYIEMDSCKGCGEPYLTPKYSIGPFCSMSCANSGENASMLGRHHTIEARKRISEHSSISKLGVLNPNYKCGITKLGLSRYDAYKHLLEIYEEVRKQEGTEILEVKCVYCGRWFAPVHNQVIHRLAAINNLNKGEARFYCSENCKQACPTYGQKMYPKGFKHTTSREVNPYLRQMVLKRDNWTCQICGKTILEIQLHVHHMDPVAQNPMFQNDADSCVTLCKKCHAMVHSRRGCRYVDLQCKKK